VRVPPQFIPTIGGDESVTAAGAQQNETAAAQGQQGNWRMPPLR
jgi:hypothetical protein